MTHTEAASDHTIRLTKDTTGVVHDTTTPPLATINPAVIHHIAHYLHLEALPPTPGIAEVTLLTNLHMLKKRLTAIHFSLQQTMRQNVYPKEPETEN